jgi:hypothetical protein
MASRLGIAAFLFLLYIPFAAAEERLDVEVYPGAKYDGPLSLALMRNPALQGAAFRTDDDIERVAAFYRKKGLLFLKMGSRKESARFKDMEKNVDVVIQQPWKDPQSHALMKDTLILIMREKETGEK